MAVVNVGLDLGQKYDHTAIVVAELEKRESWHYLTRYLERLPLGTPYPDVAKRVAGIMARLKEYDTRLWVDATGLGQPVVDMLRQAGAYRLIPVYLTGTDRAVSEGGGLRLGKAVMVSRLQVLLQSERVHLPDSPEAAVLVQELLNYEIRITDDGHAQFGAFKVGTHDDLATALGLACWWEPREQTESGDIPSTDDTRYQSLGFVPSLRGRL